MKTKVELTATALSEINAYHKKLYRRPRTDVESDLYRQRIEESIAKFEEHYANVDFFQKLKSHTFTALCFGTKAARYPEHTLYMVLTRKGKGVYLVSSMTEESLPDHYNTERVLAEARMIYDEN